MLQKWYKYIAFIGVFLIYANYIFYTNIHHHGKKSSLDEEEVIQVKTIVRVSGDIWSTSPAIEGDDWTTTKTIPYIMSSIKRQNTTKYSTIMPHKSNEILKEKESTRVHYLSTCTTQLACKEKNTGIKFNVSIDPDSFHNISAKHPDMIYGGSWKPSNCVSKSRIALILPYRDREVHLKLFLKNIIPFLKAQNKSFSIFVVEQTGPGVFNKAQLMNAGYIESQKLAEYNCFIFHDVDMLPMNLCNLYDCPRNGVRHLGLSRDTEHPHIVYKYCIGGASAFTKDLFHRINGFTNVMFGWGGEDDDAYYRLRKLGIKIRRHSPYIGNYIGLQHSQSDWSNPKSYRKTVEDHNKYMMYDGLNSVNYQLINITKEVLFTRISVYIPGPRSTVALRSYFLAKTKEFQVLLEEDLKNNFTLLPVKTKDKVKRAP